MSVTEPQPPARKPAAPVRGKIFACCCLVGGAFTVWLKVQAYVDGKALRFFSENHTAFILGMVGMFLVCGLLFFGLCAIGHQAVRHRRFSIVHASGMAFLILLPALPTGDLYLAGAKTRLLPINEEEYVSFAQEVRARFGAEGISSVALRDLDHVGEPAEKRRAEALLKILEGSRFADWPREMLSVQVRPDSVSLIRGSGMLGRMGVEIFDQKAEPGLTEPADSDRNLYGVGAYPLSGRVSFIRGD